MQPSFQQIPQLIRFLSQVHRSLLLIGLVVPVLVSPPAVIGQLVQLNGIFTVAGNGT